MEEMQNECQQTLKRHEREKKELKDCGAAMKSEVEEGDQKKQQLLLDMAGLEVELEQKHKQELEGFQNMLPDTNNLSSITEDKAKMNPENPSPLYLRAQRRRERRAALERKRLEKLTEAKVEQLTCHQRVHKRLVAILDARYLKAKKIPAGGNCMYHAVQDQLKVKESVESLRARAADYMRQHVDDFLPFFPESETGVPYTRDDFMIYCDKVADSTMWGGQVELRALTHVLQTPIEVIQADGPIIIMGEEYSQKPITLIYKHYAYHLGEHYNSVKPKRARAVGGSSVRGF